MKKIVAGKKPRADDGGKEPENLPPTGGNIVSIMDALKRSLGEEKKRGGPRKKS